MEFAALLAQDKAAIGELGLERIAVALTSLFEGIPPEEDFGQHGPTPGRPGFAPVGAG